MDYSAVVAFLGVTVYLGAFVFYNKGIATGESKPNMATWMLWAFLALINLATYREMSGDWIKSVQAYGGTIANIGTFLFALSKGKLNKLNRFNMFLFALGCLSIFVWIVVRNAAYANLVLQLCVTLSIIPTWIDVWHDPKSESPLPWFLLSGAYLFAIVVVGLRWEGQVEELVFPINCLLIQLLVGLLAIRKPSTKFKV